MRRVVIIADTHLRHDGWEVPDGDLLIHCGDKSIWGTAKEMEDAMAWFASFPHPRKVFVGGNHDFMLERDLKSLWPMIAGKKIAYLQDNGIRLLGLKIWGSPWSRTRSGQWAFNNPSKVALPAWDKIPTGLDILITHSPPNGIRDNVPGDGFVGCRFLRDAVIKAAPTYNVFGHIHEGYGKEVVGPTTYVNASICDTFYNPVNAPQIIDFPDRPANDPVMGQ